MNQNKSFPRGKSKDETAQGFFSTKNCVNVVLVGVIFAYEDWMHFRSAIYCLSLKHMIRII